ncbi:hypothetical protein VNO77_14108 [Canavalia gladiata]|uniref:Uncharacterized protein n=1 Tax=Canavalia gladiata TaxID=3824 RepID=A0AAN9M1K3_CANGL
MCRKIREALTGNPATRAIQRISSFNQEPKPVTTKTSIQTKPHPQHKAHTEAAGTIPIKFDNSTPKLRENGNKAVSIVSKEPHQARHVPNPVQDQAQGKKLVNINDIFDDYIRRTGHKLRTVSKIGWGQSNTVAAPDNEANDTNKNESHKDHFSEFILRAKKRLRTKTTVGKSGSLNKE